MKNSDCVKCEYCKGYIANGDFKFFGCLHQPYRGRWIAEIEECPKDGEQNERTD